MSKQPEIKEKKPPLDEKQRKKNIVSKPSQRRESQNKNVSLNMSNNSLRLNNILEDPSFREQIKNTKN